METTPTRFEALITCRERAGSDSQMARDLNVSQPTVWRWLNQTKQMPPVHCIMAERIYGVPKEHLRPDIYPRAIMTDQAVEDRFCGVDLRRNERREAERRNVA